jgi:hypothetical protein
MRVQFNYLTITAEGLNDVEVVRTKSLSFWLLVFLLFRENSMRQTEAVNEN